MSAFFYIFFFMFIGIHNSHGDVSCAFNGKIRWITVWYASTDRKIDSITGNSTTLDDVFSGVNYEDALSKLKSHICKTILRTNNDNQFNCSGNGMRSSLNSDNTWDNWLVTKFILSSDDIKSHDEVIKNAYIYTYERFLSDSNTNNENMITNEISKNLVCENI